MFRVIDKDVPVEPMDLVASFDIRCAHSGCEEPVDLAPFRCHFSVPEGGEGSRLMVTFEMPERWFAAVGQSREGTTVPFLLCPHHADELLVKNSEIAAATGMLRGMGG